MVALPPASTAAGPPRPVPKMVRCKACSTRSPPLILTYMPLLMLVCAGGLALERGFVPRPPCRRSLLVQRAAAPLAKDHSLDEGPLRQRHYGPAELGDMLIPPQPIGRLVQKGEDVAVEYDPNMDPEFVHDEYGYGGEFVWEPLTPEGGLI
eukprot:4414784-Amphidinium_carterae.1